MRGADLAELATFQAVARHRSFRKAATERAIAPSAVSHAIRSLEERVGVRLLHRTTRSVSLTEAGERFLADLGAAFALIEQAHDGLNRFRQTPFGAVRLNLPASVASLVLRDVLGPLTRRNPGLQLDIVATDRLVDIVAEGFDAGIRFGEVLSKDMIAVRLRAAPRFAVVGSPAYFRGRRMPDSPRDLGEHACIRYRFPSGKLFDWEFDRDGEEMAVAVDGPITLDSQELMVEAALQGCGLAYVWEDRIAAHLRSGALARCLEPWCRSADDLFLYYPSRRHLSGSLRALIDALKA